MSSTNRALYGLLSGVALAAFLVVVIVTHRGSIATDSHLNCRVAEPGVSDGFFHNFIGTPGLVSVKYDRQHPLVDLHTRYPEARLFEYLPTSVPTDGAALDHYAVVAFPFTGDTGVSARAAERAAEPVPDHSAMVCAEQADVVFPSLLGRGSVRLPAWVVTYFSPQGSNVKQRMRVRPLHSRESVVVNAQTGEPVITFPAPRA